MVVFFDKRKTTKGFRFILVGWDMCKRKKNPAEPFEVEFQVRNTGSVPVQVPIWPYLSDLQPADESIPFTYLSIALVVRAEGGPHGEFVPALGFVELYGSPDDARSLLVLRPGEWLRVRANVKLHTWPLEPTSACLQGSFWLRRITFRPEPGGGFTEVQNLYPNNTVTPPIEVHLLLPKPHAKSSQ